jgi:hypothetical protein
MSMLLTGCAAKPLVGGLAICIGVKTCNVTMAPEPATPVQQIGGGLAQALFDKFQNRGR